MPLSRLFINSHAPATMPAPRLIPTEPIVLLPIPYPRTGYRHLPAPDIYLLLLFFFYRWGFLWSCGRVLTESSEGSMSGLTAAPQWSPSIQFRRRGSLPACLTVHVPV